jgi:hypothetical protein
MENEISEHLREHFAMRLIETFLFSTLEFFDLRDDREFSPEIPSITGGKYMWIYLIGGLRKVPYLWTWEFIGVGYPRFVG